MMVRLLHHWVGVLLGDHTFAVTVSRHELSLAKTNHSSSFPCLALATRTLAVTAPILTIPALPEKWNNPPVLLTFIPPECHSLSISRSGTAALEQNSCHNRPPIPIYSLDRVGRIEVVI